jgi:hypothetical protein
VLAEIANVLLKRLRRGERLRSHAAADLRLVRRLEGAGLAIKFWTP